MTKETDRELLEKNIFQNPFIGITVTDGNGYCVMVNDAQTRITGIPKDELVGKHLQKAVKTHMLSNSSTIEVIQQKKEVNLHQTSKNGNSYDVKGVPVFDDEGNLIYIVSYLLDVTEAERFKHMVDQLKLDKEKVESQMNALLSSGKMAGETVFYGKKMEEIVDMVKRVAPSDATILITGPSGSGKELVANLVHESSNRKDKPFIKLNCSAIPEHLLESELFGYEEGAFTGGSQHGSKGIFESADGGSLLLDEIGEMPLNLQAKLLRVLQDKEVRRIGSDKSLKVDVRIVASTNAPLKDLIEEKKFREDLYYRLNVISIEVPGLEERREDIPFLTAYFLKSFNAKYGASKAIEPDVITFLSKLTYQGNIRELQNIMERLVLQCESNTITLKDAFTVTSSVQKQAAGTIPVSNADLNGKSLREMMDYYEKAILSEYLSTYKKPEEVAKQLKVDRSTISRKFKKHGL